MKEGTEQKGDHNRLEHGHLVSHQVLKVEVSLQELMNESVPFPSVLVEVGCVPEVLVELTIGKARDLSVEVGHEVENQEEADVVRYHNGLVPTRKDLKGVNSFIKQSYQRYGHTLHYLIGPVL